SSSDLVGEVAKGAVAHSFHLGHEHTVDAILPDELGAARGVLRLLRRPARLLELGPKVVELPCARIEHRPRLAGRDRFDPADTRANRALPDDHERADLGGRAHVRAAAELAR